MSHNRNPNLLGKIYHFITGDLGVGIDDGGDILLVDGLSQIKDTLILLFSGPCRKYKSHVYRIKDKSLSVLQRPQLPL